MAKKQKTDGYWAFWDLIGNEPMWHRIANARKVRIPGWPNIEVFVYRNRFQTIGRWILQWCVCCARTGHRVSEITQTRKEAIESATQTAREKLPGTFNRRVRAAIKINGPSPRYL